MTETLIAPPLWVLVAGVLIPVLSSLATKPEAPNRWRTVIAVVAAGIITAVEQATGSTGAELETAASTFSALLVTQLGAYRLVKDGLGVQLNDIAPTVGFGLRHDPLEDH